MSEIKNGGLDLYATMCNNLRLEGSGFKWLKDKEKKISAVAL